jgi:hypothetical protein
MKRPTLNDFAWIREPMRYTQRRLSVGVTVAAHTPPPPRSALLLAVSDEYFDCEMAITSEDGLEAGLVLYHTDTTFIAIGLTADTVVITSSVMGWSNRWQVGRGDRPSGSTIWAMNRTDEGVAIGYRSNGDDQVNWIGRFTLPGLEKSVSFGPYFTNGGETELNAAIEAFHYRRVE